jgi:D-alanyl-D-alanine carboxypeptidase
MRGMYACVTAGAAGAIMLALVQPAARASTAPSPTPPQPGASVTLSPLPSPLPSTDAAALEVQRQQRALATETATLAKAASAATMTLQAYQARRRDAAGAKLAATAAAVAAQAAAQAAAEARATLRAYAGSLYRTGTAGQSLLMFSATLTSQGPTQFLSGLRMAGQVANRRGQIVNGLAAAEDAADVAAADAKTALSFQQVTQARAAAANAAAERSVAAFTKQVTARRAVLNQSTSILKLAQQRDHNLTQARAVATDAGWRPSPPCPEQDVSGYANGQIPVASLCPVLFAAGHHLRADAAYAFNTMVLEYAGIFGKPLCVTDSYRSLDAQVRVAEEKPTLAAAPGHSNHGWGLAADLCGGIETFDTPTHEWMLDNAPRFGWFHPAWAEPAGGTPEPWHWEFAG